MDVLHGAASPAHTTALLCSDTDGCAEPLALLAGRCATALAGLGTAAQCHLPLVTSVCSGLSKETGYLDSPRKGLAGGGNVCGLGTGQDMEKRGEEGCGAKPV